MSTPVYLPATAIRVCDPDCIDTATIDFSGALAGTGDTVSACTVTVMSGSLEVASTLLGLYNATSAAATIVGNRATIAFKSASLGTVETRWRATTTQGRQIDETRFFQVVET